MRYAARLVALLVILVGALPAGAAPAAAVPAPPGDGGDATALQPAVQCEHRTEIVVRLWENRSATWTVRTRFPLETGNETAAFEQFESEYESGETTVGYDAALFETAAAAASRATGRRMEIRDVDPEAHLRNGNGVVTLSFTWTEFVARGENETLRVGDAFRTPDNGTWLSTLGPDQRLLVRAPPDYGVDRNPGFRQPNSSAIVIDGPARLDGADRVVLTFQQTSSQAPPDWTTLVAAGVALVGVAAAAVWYLLRRRSAAAEEATDDAAGREAPPETVTPEDGRAADADPDAGGTAVGGGAGERADANGEAAAAGSGGGAADGTDVEAVDTSLLSDEERVEHLLERNGGRMRQANIVKETGWSDAKVSQLLSSMAEEDRVDKLRLGRENLISLPEGGDGDRDRDRADG
jgi:hypothetical protein